ncbi:MAG: hypothetical protein H0V89_05315 [Deltaproteobacteria bacterium]|nr:hypothetical protein [Deltaproteobacteria bacterium]
MSWRAAAGLTVGLFAAGIAVGYVANKRGIPQDQIHRWFVKRATRRVLHAVDAIRELLPDAEPVRVTELP